MKKTKRILSIALVLVMLMSVMGIAVNAAYISSTTTNFGYMAPTDAKGTKTVSTVKLYGNYDYIDFYINSKSDDMYFFYEIYSNKNYTEKSMIDYGYFYCDTKGTYSGEAVVKLSGLYKTGTYYVLTYAATVSAYGDALVSEPSVREFKLVVDRTTAFNKQMVITKGVTNTVNGPQIKWQGVSSAATKYYIYRRPMAGTSWTKVGTASASARSFVDTSLKNKNGKFVYSVKAINKSGKATRYHYLGENCLFAKAPTLKSVATGAENIINVQWNSTSTSAYYELYRREVGQSSWTKLAGNYKKTSFTDKTAINGKTYEYTVRANIKTADGVARSAYYGNAAKAVTFVEAPYVTFVSPVENGVEISWASVSGATAYTVYRRAIDGSTGWTTLKKVSANATSFVDTTAVAQEGYIYTVRAEGSKGRGSYYTAGKAYMQLAAPTVTAELNSAKNAVTVIWTDVPNAFTYDIYNDSVLEYENWLLEPVTLDAYTGTNVYSVVAKATIIDTMTGNKNTFMSDPGMAIVFVD